MLRGISSLFVFSPTNNHSRLNRPAITAGEFDWSGEKRRTIHDEEKAEKTERFQSHSIIPRVNAPQARVRESQSRKKSNAKGREILRRRGFQRGYRLLDAEHLKWTEGTEVDVVDQMERFSSREDPPGSWILAPILVLLELLLAFPAPRGDFAQSVRCACGKRGVLLRGDH